jgi:hypothetical protein
MIAKPFNTYYTIAKIEFTTLRGIDVECRIKGLFNPATVKTFTATGSPLMITMLSGESTFTQIKGSEATLDLHNVDDFEALQLLSEGNRDYMLEVVYDGNVIWTGYMMPDQWSEPLNTTPYPSQFRFIDGLGLLKDVDFVDSTGCYYTGYFTDMQTIGYCLAEIGLRRNFVDQINIIDVDTAQPYVFGTLDEKFKNVEAFRGMNCYEVLESILKSYVARIEFYDNKYYLRRINETDETVKSVEWNIRPNLSPGYVSSYVSQNTLSITPPTEPVNTRLNWVESVQELYRLPGMKRLTINQDYGRKPTIFPRGLLDECDFSGNTIKGWSQNGVEKKEIEDNTCARFVPLLRTGLPPAYTPPAYIEGSSVDSYSTENVADETADLFDVGVVCRNENMIGIASIRSGTQSRRGSITTSKGDGVDQLGVISQIPETVNTPVGFFSDNYTFSIEGNKFDDLGGSPINWGTDKIYVIFPDVNNLPVGFVANTPYRVVVWLIVGGGVSVLFWFSPVDNPLSFIKPIAADNGKSFKMQFLFTYMRISMTAPGTDNARVTNQGNWQGDGFLTPELPLSNLQSRRFFSVGQTTDGRLLGTRNGPLSIRIEKPTGNVLRTQDDKAFLVESIQVQIVDTPESNTETITLNPRNNEEFTLDIMFAETPIKNNFINNKLKFYNNFISGVQFTPPGLQVIDGVGGASEPTTLYDYIKNSYSELLSKHRFAIAGKLSADRVSVLGKIIEEKFTKKYYLSTANSWDVFKHYHEITLHEIADTPEFVPSGDFNDDFNDDFN